MSNVTQRIGPLVGGVSQAPSHMRASEYASALLNALIHPTQGITKRPGTKHIAKLANSSDEHYASAMLFPFTAGDKRRYFVSVNDGAIRVVEADTGIEHTVSATADALAYLSGIGDASRPFSAVASGDQLYILNRNRVVAKGTKETPYRQSEALVSIRAADYGTSYSVILDGVYATYKTPPGTSADARSALSTDNIATQLAQALRSVPGQDAFEILQEGSTLYIHRTDGNGFSLVLGDGLADIGMTLCYGTVKAGMDLPPTGVVEGFTVRVQGDPRTAADDYWMTWLEGVWQECPRPGTLVELDASTLPHVLTLGGALHDGLVVPQPPAPPAADSGAGAVFPLAWDTGSPVAGSVKIGWFSTADFLVTPGDGTAGGIVDVRYTLDMSGIGITDSVDVILSSVAGDGSLTELATRHYQPTGAPGENFQTLRQNEVLSATAAFTAGQRIRLSMSLSSTNPFFSPTVTTAPTGPSKGSEAGIRYTSTHSGQFIIPDATYPASAQFSFTADGVTVTHTVGAAGESAATIAAAVVAAWPVGSVKVLDLGSGHIKVWNTATGTAPVVSAAVIMDTDHTLWVPGEAFVPGSLVGRRFINLTTGAEGTVTANTAMTVTADSLTGGSRSTLLPGDFIRVSAALDTFTLTPVAWEARTAGDDDSNPFPSFVGRTISNIGVVQNRLVLQPGEYFVASGSGKFGRFFRTTTQQVLDSDPIDVRGIASQGLPYWHMVEWNGAPHLLNGRSLYAVVAGDNQVLTPRTVSIQHVYELSSNEVCSPVVVGRTLFVARVKNEYTQLLGLEASGQGVGVDSADTTQAVPTYLKGSPLLIAADADAPLIIVTEDALGRYLYAAQPVDAGRSTLYAWAAWRLDPSAEPIAASMEGGDLVLMLKRADGVYLESVDTLVHLT